MISSITAATMMNAHATPSAISTLRSTRASPSNLQGGARGGTRVRAWGGARAGVSEPLDRAPLRDGQA